MLGGESMIAAPWLNEKVEELRKAARPLEIPRPSIIPLETPPEIVLAVRGLRQVIREWKKPVKVPKTAEISVDFSWIAPLTEDFSNWLRKERAKEEKSKRQTERFCLKMSEEKLTLQLPDELVEACEELRSLAKSFGKKIKIPKIPPLRMIWLEKACDGLWDLLLERPEFVQVKKQPIPSLNWLKETIDELREAMESLAQQPKIIALQKTQLSFFWLKKPVEELYKALRRFERAHQLPVLEPVDPLKTPSWLRGWVDGIRRELRRIQKPTPLGRWAKKDISTTPSFSWLDPVVDELRGFLPKKSQLVKTKEISWERRPPVVPSLFPEADKRKKGDNVVRHFTQDSERVREWKLRMSHPQPTHRFKRGITSKKNRRGWMRIVGISTKKVDTRTKGRRSVKWELETASYPGAIDLSEIRLASWKKFDFTTGKVVEVGRETGSGHDGWKAQQEELLTRLETSCKLGARQATIPESWIDSGERIAILANDGKVKNISFAEYIQLEGSMMRGVSSELHRKFEI